MIQNFISIYKFYHEFYHEEAKKKCYATVQLTKQGNMQIFLINLNYPPKSHQQQKTNMSHYMPFHVLEI